MKALHGFAGLLLTALGLIAYPAKPAVASGPLLLVAGPVEESHVDLFFTPLIGRHPEVSATTRSVTADSARLTITDGSGRSIVFTIIG